ncbi:hypothetical protein AIGOOFII_4046 [Methylobacterium marchantiae]|nr:hypothetical protein AIGOOFII_4046 [Methylobacterium marchantiae]
MPLRIHHGVAHGPHVVEDARTRIDPHPDRQGVDEQADEPLRLGPIAVGDGDADAQVRLTGIALEKQGEDGEEDHRRGGAGLPRQGFETRRHIGIERELDRRPAEALDSRTWPVGRQRDHALRCAEAFAPPVELPVELARLQPVALPARVIGIGDRHRRESGDLPLGVEAHQLREQDLHRAAIGDEMVHGQEENVALGLHPHQYGSQQGRRRQIEGPPGLLPRQDGETVLA